MILSFNGHLVMNERLAKRTEDISAFYVMEILRRAKQLEEQGVDVIHMEIGEPDFLSPPRVVSEGIRFLEAGNVKYTPAAGAMELRQKIADFYLERYNVSVDPGRIFITPGATGAFLLAFGVSLNPGEEVLMADPCYPCNSNFIRLFEGQTKLIPVDAKDRYQLSAELIEQHWGQSTKGVLIASPSNPTGTVISPEALKAAVLSVDEKRGCFYSDEIYHGLAYGERTASALEFSDKVFVINSFSKYFCMTGWRIGWVIVPEEFVEATERLAQNIFISTPSNSQYAAIAAFDSETIAELERRRLEFAARRDFLYHKLLELGFSIPVKPEGAFYIYADCSKFTLDSYQLAMDLLEEEGVAVTPGRDFGQHNANHTIRFAYTTSLDRIAQAILRLENFINRKFVDESLNR
jgi:aspartate/methionine/tyrosine aminotransferase